MRISDVIDHRDVNLYRELAGGVTTINVLHGSCNAIGGQNAVLKLRWGKPPEELHLARLMSDEIVCLVAEDHPVVRSAATRAWTAERYLACEHVAPTPLHAGLQGAAPGVIDEHLSSLGLSREIMVRSAHFSLIPLMVAQSLLVLTTGRLFCSRYVDALPVRIVRCPVAFPPLTYYQLWHDLTHASASGRWLREQVRDVARNLATHGMPQRSAASRTTEARSAEARSAEVNGRTR